jgi:predicted lysophospholipase L1 biosynthesis ABC-type transport system permease subunit
LDSIRDKDEQYWEQWKGTPKAFISINTATDLWQNRYGTYTSLRYSAENTNREKLESDVLSQITPADVGFKAESVRQNAEKAAGEGVDFSELFAGLSFFLLAGGVLLGVLLFLLNLEFRKEQIHTLSALGISKKAILRIMFAEGIIIAFAGALLGLFLAIIYNQAVFNALNGIWNDIVRTEMLVVHIKNSSLVKGFLFSLVISAFSILIPLNRYLKKNLRNYKTVNVKGTNHNKKFYIPVSGITGIVATGLILREIVNSETQNAGATASSPRIRTRPGRACVQRGPSPASRARPTSAPPA